jgi:hypothetical protein
VKIHMGDYALHSFQKKESFEGFTYFLFTLHRKKLPAALQRGLGEAELSSPVLPDLQGDLERTDKKA